MKKNDLHNLQIFLSIKDHLQEKIAIQRLVPTMIAVNLSQLGSQKVVSYTCYLAADLSNQFTVKSIQKVSTDNLRLCPVLIDIEFQRFFCFLFISFFLFFS